MPLLPRDVGGQGGGIEEAPLDGKLYGRRMARWDPVPTLLTLIYYRGPFATPDELRAAHPTDIPGAYAVVSSTSSIWIWNHDKWEDTGATQTQAGILDAPKDGKTYGRKDGDWVVTGSGTVNEEQVVNIIKNTPHNDLKSIQGGKVEDGKVTEAYHLTKEQWEGLPIRPFVMFPANNATNINQVPQIVGSPYAHPHDTLMYMKHIQISKAVDFATLAYEKEEVSRSVTFQVPLKPDNSPCLEENTLYYVRIRYRDRRMRWSHWSAPVKFKTMVQFPAGILLTPVMLAPVDGGQVQGINPVLAMSAPKVAVGSANFDKADWQVSTDSTFGTTIYDKVASDDITMHTTENLNMVAAIGVDYFARGRQRTTDGIYTPWAIPVRFGVRSGYEDPIFGLRRIFSKRMTRPYAYNIDIEGNMVHIAKRYWDLHPLYTFLKQDIVVGKNAQGADVKSEMAFVPPCWTKYAVYENDEGDMVIDLWFSPTETKSPGWILDPAFSRSPNGLYIGRKFAGYTQVQHGGSFIYVAVSNSNLPPYANSDTYIENLRIMDSTWHSWNIYERRLILDLMTAEHLYISQQAFFDEFGQANVLNSFWRGIEGLFFKNNQLFSVKVDGYRWKISQDKNLVQIEVLDTKNQPILKHYFSPGISTTKALCPTSITRGYNSSVNIDVVLLGIVDMFAENANGELENPWGMNKQMTISTSGASATDTPQKMISLADAGTFGILPQASDNGREYIRVAKWLD